MLSGMKTLSFVTCSLLVAIFGGVASTKTTAAPADWAEQAVSTDEAVARTAQEHLRAEGPQGLQALEQRFAKEIAAHRGGAISDENWRKIAIALDRVGGQYDNYASGLYWYTDLEAAKAAARASGKPILSLRLLGRLDEDLSCANSRFFRTTLYPNAAINRLLNDRFVLHWDSVRPAPRVTIDFGDGRKLERTITGNSIHYVLDPEGRIVDALPGLYGAPAFEAELAKAADAVAEARQTGTLDYAAHMQSTQDRLLHAWAADLKTIDAKFPSEIIASSNAGLTESRLESVMDDSKWQKLADLHDQAGFDSHVMELMARKLRGSQEEFPSLLTSIPVKTASGNARGTLPSNEVQPMTVSYPAEVAAPIAVSKMAVESPLLAATRKLSSTVALDTVRNNYMLRSKILAYLISHNSLRSSSLAVVNDWVYARVFLTPRQDPWLGLAPNDVFAAIDRNGRLE